MIYLIDPVEMLIGIKSGCKTFCSTLCTTKCPKDFVQPLYGIPD